MPNRFKDAPLIGKISIKYAARKKESARHYCSPAVFNLLESATG